MKLYAPGGLPIRHGVGFTAERYLIRSDGDETTATGVAPARGEPYREIDPVDEREEPRCRG